MPKAQFPDIAVPGTGKLYARFVTSVGNIVVELAEEKAPNTVKNFVGLATGTQEWKDPRPDAKGAIRQGVPLYDGTLFHRVIPDFMIQGGDPLGKGMGGPGYDFADEFHPELRHDRPGVLSMANAGPGTNGSQFFITEKPTTWLDRKHSVFGHTVVGIDLIGKITHSARDGQDRPKTPIVVEKVEIFRSESAPTA